MESYQPACYFEIRITRIENFVILSFRLALSAPLLEIRVRVFSTRRTAADRENLIYNDAALLKTAADTRDTINTEDALWY